MDQKTDWRIERGLEILLLLLLAAAAFGLLGRPSPAVKTFTGSGLRMKVEYKPVSRLGLGEDLQIAIAPTGPPGGGVRLMLSSDYLEGFDLERVTPQPESETLSGDDLVFAFAAPPAGSDLHVKIELTARKAGMHKGRLQASIGGLQILAAGIRTRIWP